MAYPFNVRVYGILINDRKQVLLSDEIIRGRHYTKFPGGGLHFGEGTKECLQREFMEEMGIKVSIEDHIYTSDFFQRSKFAADEQVIAVYYRVKFENTEIEALRINPFDFGGLDQVFRWYYLKNLTENDLSFPIDRKVLPLIKNLI